MKILLICIFEINAHSSGKVRTLEMKIPKAIYETIKFEEGQSEKLKLCRQAFHQNAEMAHLKEASN